MRFCVTASYKLCKVIDFAVEIVSAYLEDLVDSGLDLITVPEPVASGDLIRPSVFEQYVLPADVKVKDRLSARCPSCLIHICGRTDKLVVPVADARMGVFLRGFNRYVLLCL